MDKKTYSIIVGCIMLAACFMLILSVALLDIDAFIPVIMAIVSFIVALYIFFSGLSER